VRFVVTAGPTREAIDPVRFLSNRSSGKMGYAIANAALAAGHKVTLISGPACLVRPAGAQFISITASDELYREVRRAIRECDALVMCAAVADYKPARVESRKMKKRRTSFALQLVPTRDILASLPQGRRKFLVIGFAAETHDLKTNAQRKLREKNCDMIVANDVSNLDSGMESDVNAVTIFLRSGESQTILRTSKQIIACELVKIISKMSEKYLTKKA
jgi:phosphopantothenoylcysteine decarboxylase / phosphopantothenate---cysteine ligase